MTKPTVAVAMSGGVDSSVTCMLLAQQGFKVFGITMKVLGHHSTPLHAACAPAIEDDAREVCRKLGVPHYTVDLTEEFEEEIVKPFVESYAQGKTPNPCVMCNGKFKFGRLLNKARELGADYLATGHYARVGRILEQTGEFTENMVIAGMEESQAQAGSRYLVARGKDPKKDQSYVLYRLSQDMLAHAMFPLGNFTKDRVKDISRQMGLVAEDKPESQEICFVGGAGWNSYRELLRVRNVEARPGLIVDTSGKVVGRHKGLPYYTIGQRRGLGISAPYSLYVVDIDPKANQVIVGKREEAYALGCYIRDVNFIVTDHPEGPVRGTCMVRYRGHEVGATLIPRPEGCPDGDNLVLVKFDEPQFAVTPGQSLVFYQGEFVYGGGIIAKAVK